MPLRIKVANSDAEVAQVFELRGRCLQDLESTVHELAVVDIVDAYPTTFHVLILVGHQLIASLRVASLSAAGSATSEHETYLNSVDVGPNVQPYVLGRICIDRAHRNEKIIRHLFSKATLWAQARGATQVLAHLNGDLASVAVGEGFQRRADGENSESSADTQLYSLEVPATPTHLSAIGDFGEMELGDPLERVVYDRGEEIIKQAERGYCAYVMTRGVADVVVEGHGDTETPIATLGAGALFGELALLADARRSATVRAQRECEVLRVTPAVFRNFIRENQENAEKVIALLSSRQQVQLAGLVGTTPTESQRQVHGRSHAPTTPAKVSSDYQSLLRGRASNTVLFGDEEMAFWLELYKSVAEEHVLQDPFFTHTHNTKQFSKYSTDHFITCDVPELGEIGFLGGSLSAFSPEFVAAFTASQLTAYVDRGALGSLPRQAAYMRDLTAAHLEGFDATDRLITFVSRNKEGQLCPLVGAKLVRGKTSRLLKDVNGDASSTLPTFRAVRVIDPAFDSSQGELTENDVVCLSSYFSADFRGLGVTQRSVLMLTELLIAMAGLCLTESPDNDQAPPVRAVFDTHIDALVRKYERDFGAVYAAGGDEVVATPATTDPQQLSGILRYHYGPRELGGYHGRINVVAVDGDEYAASSMKYLHRFQKRFNTGTIVPVG